MATGVNYYVSGNITVPPLSLVDGRDVSVDGNILDLHVVNTNNPHMVSFDGRTTWYRRSGAAWVSDSDLTNIHTSGMDKATIEALTETDWGNVFVAGTIDFAM